MLNRLRPLESKIIGNYRTAGKNFQSGLDQAKGKDLDCQGHLAILRFENKRRTLARQELAAVLKKYTPQNDEERTVFEYCRSLFYRMGGRL